MAKLVMMRGLPGSGKTTEANRMMKEAGNMVRVNRDSLRPMLHGDAKWSGKKEKITRRVQSDMVKDLLTDDISVIVDDTNLRDADRDRWSNIADDFNARFEICDIDTDFDECVIRDSHREGDARVGLHVIASMALSSGRFPHRNIVLCDIDGTVADLTHRLHHIRDGNRNWNRFFAEVSGDKFREPVWDQVLNVAHAHDAVIIFLSGRSEVARYDTVEWLWENTEGAIGEPIVLMRREFDRRPDTEVKRDMYDWHFKNYNVVKVFDDRPCMVRMWRDMGLDVVDVGDGVEF